MNVGDIVFLKSGSPKFIVEWIVGVTTNNSLPFDMNAVFMNRPNYQVGDVAVKWLSNGKEEKFTFPSVSLIDNVANLTSVSTTNVSLGCVVRHQLSERLMTVIWVIGTASSSTGVINYNEMLKLHRSFADGDVVCAWFENENLNSQTFKVIELTKVYD